MSNRQIESDVFKFSTTQWITWLGATLTACVTLTAFAYQTFQTKADADQVEVRRRDGRKEILDQIQNLDRKIEILIQRTAK